MLKYGDFIAESLAAEIKSEPKTAAAKEARKLGLTYMGFGRYADNKGQIAYLVHNDRLVPYKSQDEIGSMYNKQQSAPKKAPASGKGTDKNVQKEPDWKFYSDALNKRQKEDDKILQEKDKLAEATHKELSKFYKPNMFSEDEFDAIYDYTNEAYGPVNRYLYKGHDPEVAPEEDEIIANLIQNLDSAFEETQSPFAYTVYSGLSDRYNAKDIKPGGEYIFRGYLSASLRHDVAISSFASGGDMSVVLQIEIAKGQKSIYVDSLSEHEGERETILPRGTKIKVISGPHVTDYGIMNSSADEMKIALFHCTVIEDQ